MSKETRSAVVTGAATGLGFATAKMLKKQGWTVFGTYMDFQDPSELKKLGIIPICVDITKEEEAFAARDAVAAELGDAGLYALCNVAGGTIGGVIEGVSYERARKFFDINIDGTLNMCRAFLPLLRKYGKGARVVNVSSSALRVPAVFTSHYSISKYAIEGITNALRFEMMPFGIQATSIEPGGMKTPMTAGADEATEKNWVAMPQEIQDVYKPALLPSLSFINSMMGTASTPDKVAKVIVKALNKDKMKKRYMAGITVAWMAPFERIAGENAFEAIMAKMQKLS